MSKGKLNHDQHPSSTSPHAMLTNSEDKPSLRHGGGIEPTVSHLLILTAERDEHPLLREEHEQVGLTAHLYSKKGGRQGSNWCEGLGMRRSNPSP